jgi:putative dimethyl sulfoxide reductase chaperone
MSDEGAEPTSHAVLEQLDAYAAATGFVSRLLLASPDGPLLAQLSGPEVLTEWPLDGAHSVDGLAALAVSLADGGETMEQMHDDWQHLFLGPENVLACPYESVYLNEEHLTFGSQTLAVRKWYRDYGFQAPAEGREPDDHIGLELLFVSLLCRGALDAADHDNAEGLVATCLAMGEFLKEHLLLWADQCLDHIQAHAQTQFYQGVGQLTRDTLRGLERDFAG